MLFFSSCTEPIVRTAKQKPVLAASAFTHVYAQKDALPSQTQAAPERAQDLIKDFLSRTSMYAGPSARDASAESAQVRCDQSQFALECRPAQNFLL